MYEMTEKISLETLESIKKDHCVKCCFAPREKIECGKCGINDLFIKQGY